jgi:hypothetical protein
MCVRLHHHLTINNILDNEQFGFRTNYSALKAINRLLDQTLTALNASHSVAGIFCDLKMGFDCINRKISLPKLQFYSVLGRMRKLIILSYRKISKDKTTN